MKDFFKNILIFLLNNLLSKQLVNKILFNKSQFGSSYPKEYYEQIIEPDSWQLIPISVRVFYPSVQKVITSNKFGFRTSEFNYNENKDVIIITGGSSAWGLGASNDKNVFANQLEKLLNKNQNNSCQA